MKRIPFIFSIFLLANTWMSIHAQSNEKVRFTFTERFRLVGWDNAIDLDKNGGMNQLFTRHRSSAGLKWNPNHSFAFEAKLTHEFRKYFTPANATFHWNELFVDQLYVSYQSEKYFRGKLTLGRQNIFLGEGFVIWDGHPIDGSRSAYFNAIRYDLKLNEKHAITSFFAYQPKEDNLLPVINGKDIDAVFQGEHSYQLIEQSEKAAAVYYQGKASAIEHHLYYIWKAIADDGTRLIPKSDIHTFGARLRHRIKPQLSYTIEAAYQGGSLGNEKRSAYGGHGYLTYSPAKTKFFIPTELSPGAFLFSGDRLSTTSHEAWEPLFGRWPKWSESYIYTSLRENQGRIAYWSNMVSPNIQSKFALGKGMTLNINYFRLFAMKETLQTDFLSGQGKFRGSLLTAQLNFRINKQLTGHLLWEHFQPGNFYFETADPYHWARVELIFSL
jgi:hypothetical protein